LLLLFIQDSLVVVEFLDDCFLYAGVQSVKSFLDGGSRKFPTTLWIGTIESFHGHFGEAIHNQSKIRNADEQQPFNNKQQEAKRSQQANMQILNHDQQKK
jgi:hypothetical protein